MIKESARAETYDDVERMLCKIVRGFLAKHKGGQDDGFYSFDDAMSVAKIAYLEAYNAWSSEKQIKFSTWCAYYVVYRGLINQKRKAMRVKQRPPNNGVARFSEMTNADDNGFDFAGRQPGFMERIFRDASRDAATIITMLLDTPTEVAECWFNGNGHVASERRAEVRESVRTLGWSPSRFWRAWWEAAELVCD